MTIRANPPRLNWIAAGLGLLLVLTIALCAYMLVLSEWGTSPDPVYASWFFGGLFTLAFTGGGLLVLLTWHAFAQREVAIDPDTGTAHRPRDTVNRARASLVWVDGAWRVPRPPALAWVG